MAIANDNINDGFDGGGGIELAPGVSIPWNKLRLQYARSSGPGGQNVNKVNTKAELWVPIGAIAAVIGPAAAARLAVLAGSRITVARELHLWSESERTQEGNRQELFAKLRDLIVRARVRPKIRRVSKPSRAAKARRLDSKRRRSEIKSNRRAGGHDS